MSLDDSVKPTAVAAHLVSCLVCCTLFSSSLFLLVFVSLCWIGLSLLTLWLLGLLLQFFTFVWLSEIAMNAVHCGSGESHLTHEYMGWNVNASGDSALTVRDGRGEERRGEKIKKPQQSEEEAWGCRWGYFCIWIWMCDSRGECKRKREKRKERERETLKYTDFERAKLRKEEREREKKRKDTSADTQCSLNTRLLLWVVYIFHEWVEKETREEMKKKATVKPQKVRAQKVRERGREQLVAHSSSFFSGRTSTIEWSSSGV